MKKFLSVLLALTMIFSSVAFAAPSMMGTVSSAEETQAVQETENDAVVMEETAQGIYDEQYGLLVAKMDFSNLEEGATLYDDVKTAPFVSYKNFPAEFVEAGVSDMVMFGSSKIFSVKEENNNKYCLSTIGPSSGWAKFGFISVDENRNAKAMPDGLYTIKFNEKALAVTVKNTETNEDVVTEYTDEYTTSSKWTALAWLANTDGAFGQNRNFFANAGINVSTTIASNNWERAIGFRFLDGVAYEIQGGEKKDFAGLSAVLTMYNAGGVANTTYTYAIDDMELYYKAPNKVTFLNGGVNDAKFVKVDGTEVDNTITMYSNVTTFKPSDYKYTNTSDKLFKGWVDEKGNTVWNTTEISGSKTLTAQWEDAYHDDYGMLVAAVDFEKLALNSTWANGGRKLASEVGIIADNYPENFPVMYVQHTATSGTIEGSDSDKYLTFYTKKTNGAGNQSWPRISFITADNKASHGFFPEGSYTMVWTLKDDETRNVNVSSSKNANNIYWWNGTSYNEINSGFTTYPNTAITSGLKAGWSTTVAQKSILEGDTVTSGIGVFKGIGAFQAMPTVTATKDAIVGKTTNSKGELVDAYTYECYTFIDDVKLYYKAPSYVSFVDSKGYANNLPDTAKSNSPYTLPAITTSRANTRFLGWSLEENGEVISSSTVNLNGDTTLYAVWAEGENHPEYGKTLFNIDFEHSTNFANNALYKHGYVNADDENAVKWYMTASGFANNKYSIYGENKDGVIVYKDGEKVITEGVTDYTVVNKFLGANGAASTNPQFVPTTGENANLTFAPKGYFTISSRTAYDKDESYSHTISDETVYQFRHFTYAWKDAEHTATVHQHDSLLTFKDIIKETKGDNIWKSRVSQNYQKDKDFVVSSFTLTEKVNGVDTKVTYNDIKETTSLFRFLIYFTYSNRKENAVKDLFKLDDLVLYWKPFTANLTLDLGNGETLALLTDYDTINIVDADTVLGENANAVIGGKMLKGISKTQGGEAITEDFYLTENTTVYPVWSDDAADLAPVVSKSNSIRTDSHNGIRFLASVTKNQKKYATEYGFIVTRSTILANLGLENTDLRFDMDRQDAYVYGANYIKGTQTDLIFKTTENEIFFTGVVTGMPAEKRFYEEDMVARPYIKYNDGTIVYGDANSRSVLSVAEAIRDNGFVNDDGSAMSQSAVSFIKNILSICGVATEA